MYPTYPPGTDSLPHRPDHGWKRRLAIFIPYEYDANFGGGMSVIDPESPAGYEHRRWDPSGRYADRFSTEGMITWALWEASYFDNYFECLDDILDLVLREVSVDKTRSALIYLYEHPKFFECAPGAEPYGTIVQPDWFADSVMTKEKLRRRFRSDERRAESRSGSGADTSSNY